MKKISLIAAMGLNGIIGKDNSMPWHMPADLKFFKKTTMGKSIIMGRKTWNSIGKPLPGRKNIVITRNAKLEATGAYIATSIEEAIDKAESDEVMIIGGATIYKETMPLAANLYITRINHHFDGDACFPDIDPMVWQQYSIETHQPDDKNQYSYDFIHYQRQRPDNKLIDQYNK